jgi:hypothetical protein
MKDWSARPRQNHRHALAWTLLAGASFLLANAWLVIRYLG